MVNKEFRPDVIWFNSFIITVLCVFAVILVRFEALNIFFAFGLFGVFLLVAVLSYMIGLQRGLLLSVGVTFCYGSYLIYAVIISKEMFFSMYSLYDIVLLEKMGADVYIDFLALLCFPVGGFLGGELSAVVEKNMFKIASVSELEKLVTLDGSTGFYNQQGFFKQLEEEVGRAKRYGTSFSLLLFQISNLQQLQSIYKKQDIMFIKKTVAEIVASKLRFTDCKGILDDGSIGVILPQTESGGLNIVVSKIDTAVGLIPVKLSSAKRMVRVRTSLGYATIENTDTDYKMLYLRAKEDLVNGS